MAPPTPNTHLGHAPIQQYTAQHYNKYPDGKQISPLRSPTGIRHHPYGQDGSDTGQNRKTPDIGRGLDGKSITARSVRRRISRACDQCNQLRTKCDGKGPCAHCVEFGLSCEYVRERKKRGKASRKNIGQQDSVTAASGARSPHDISSEGPSPNQPAVSRDFRSDPRRSTTGQQAPQSSLPESPSTPASRLKDFRQSNGRHGTTINDRPERALEIQNKTPVDPALQRFPDGHQSLPPLHNGAPFKRQPSVASPTAISLNGFSLNQTYDRPALFGASPSGVPMTHNGSSSHQNFQGFNENAYAGMSPAINQAPSPGFRFGGAGESPFPGFLGNSPIVGSPGWLNLPSPSTFQQKYSLPNPHCSLRYPVLQPLLPYIESIIPISLACDLLELYFTSSSSTYMHPISPYVIGYVFRKKSFLSPVRPRSCSPALLSSMLWLAAQTSDSPFLTSPPSARGRVCQKLLEITVALLKPLMHGPPTGENANNTANPVINSVALGGLGVAMTGGEQLTAESGASGPLDVVATYIHLAVIVSASEYKAASMRWWNAAFSFARELRLNREVVSNPVDGEQVHEDVANMEGPAETGLSGQSSDRREGNGNLPASAPGAVSEEEREERRRIWWLLYTVDRHLSLCYNKPLFLLDAECESLFQPMNDVQWQSGNFYGSEATYSGSPQYRARGPNFLCTGHSIFGYFTPLMTILGEIVDMHVARDHPRFGQRSRSAAEWDEQALEITSQLNAYAQSLKEFESHHAHSPPPDPSNNPISDTSGTGPSSTSRNACMSDSVIQTKIVIAYGTHVMHVLHILVSGKWDPISLLDDNDLWISSASFISAMGHAVSAAEAISDILEFDPDLSFMPWFFGISLLQGSFLLLLIADKLAAEASPAVVKACENIVRAHEVCVVTLNTEYQRHMRKVMRSALAQVRGRIPDDFGEQQLRRREVLSLYRWTGDGTGLAL